MAKSQVPRSAELDELTLRRAQRGDDAACRALVECYQGLVFGFLSRMIGTQDHALVEDIAQDTFLSVFRSLDGYQPGDRARLSTWILTLASRRAVDALRKRRPDPASSDVERPTSDSALGNVTLRRALRAAIDGLDPRFRAAFVLREYIGMDTAEVARALDVSEGTVKSRLSRARAQIRKSLGDRR